MSQSPSTGQLKSGGQSTPNFGRLLTEFWHTGARSRIYRRFTFVYKHHPRTAVYTVYTTLSQKQFPVRKFEKLNEKIFDTTVHIIFKMYNFEILNTFFHEVWDICCGWLLDGEAGQWGLLSFGQGWWLVSGRHGDEGCHTVLQWSAIFSLEDSITDDT